MTRKIARNIICFSISILLLMGLSGCNAESTAKEIDYKGKKVLKLWHIWAADTETQKKPFEKVLQDFMNENPNIVLEVDKVENEAYKTKIKTAIAVNEAPDVFFTWGAGFAKPFVRSGRVLDINDYVTRDGTLRKVVPGSLDNFKYDGKIYALPMYMWSAILYCNQELFDKVGVKVPYTYDQLLEAIKVFNEHKITPIVAGEKEKWPGMFFHNILAIRTAGVQMSYKALNKEASFDTPDFTEGASRLDELVKLKAFDRGVMALTKDEAEAEFKLGRAAMYYMGNWAAQSWDEEGSPIKGKVVCRNFPAVPGAKGNQGAFLGGSIETFMVSANTQYKTEAVALTRYICQNMSRLSAQHGFGIPAWKEKIDTSKLPPLNAQIYDLVNSSTGFVLAWDTFMEGADADLHKNLVAEIFAGTKTPEEFSKEMQKINKSK